jgi:hypothetical protein
MENQPAITLKNRPYFNDCVEWNQDGQLVVCLDNHIHIIVITQKHNYVFSLIAFFCM